MQTKLKSSKHSKIKNTGLLFEVLSKKFINEVTSNSKPVAVNLLRKYFSNTELAKEFKIFQVILSANSLNEAKANVIFDVIKESYKSIDKNKLYKEKYNLIKEMRSTYVDNDDIFQFRIDKYNVLAAINNYLESFSNEKYVDPSVLIKHKTTILEHITSTKKTEINQVVESFKGLKKSDQEAVFTLMVEKFNKKYKVLTESQKEVLRTYLIQNNTPQFIDYLNDKFEKVMYKLKLKEALIDDDETKQNLNEVISTIKPLSKKCNVRQEDIVKLLNCYDLMDELENFNNDND